MRSELFRERVAKDPTNPLFRFSLGQALYEEGTYADCREHLDFCVRSRADWMMPRILLGKALLETGEVETARPLLEDALQLAIDQHHEDPATELQALLADL